MARIYVAWRNPNWLLPFSCNVRPTQVAAKIGNDFRHSQASVTEWEKILTGVRRLLRDRLVGTVSRSPPQWGTDLHLPKRVRQKPMITGVFRVMRFRVFGRRTSHAWIACDTPRNLSYHMCGLHVIPEGITIHSLA
jgi:hypothetical protein